MEFADKIRRRPGFYAPAQIALHWLVALLVMAQYMTSGAIDRTHHLPAGQEPDPTDVLLHAAHNYTGMFIVALMIARLALRWRLGAPEALPVGQSRMARFQQGFAQALHLAFYGLLIAQGVTGFVASYLWWPASALHVILFQALFALVCLHIAGAIWHLFVTGDGTMQRMTSTGND